ncbi:maternal protein tudor [Asbolus verrucosus]|uniref:Maternal protein tudor n=1 Tax=Asbolus verrucosus TaxID=1661398 RepID=A0A482V4D2_ASBVE|nr:maternal protein tudor [Asbolus verrucosus]
MESSSNCLFITYVEKEGPFLKVWGQTDKNTSLYIEQVLHSFTGQFDNGLCIPHPETLQIGILCCAKYKDNKYYRAKITSLNFLHNRYIEVNFIDYGHKDVVPVTNIRSLEGFESSFVAIQPQAASFLLAEAVCPRGEWNDAYLDEICKEIRYSEVNFSIIAQVTKHYLVRLFVGVNNLAILLISKGLMRHTSLTTQEAVLLSMMPRSPQQPVMQQNIATYKAFTLEPGSQYEVYVSYVTDGPCNFSVQLKQSEEVLGKLMKEINSMNLTPVEGIPIPGTVCLARCMEDGHICRAVVTNEVDGHFKVFYVDFGNFEVIPLEALYEIPFKYVIPKVMAIRFALAGVEKSTVTLEMQCAFKQFVDNRLIHMKVMPMTARTSLPRCELWDPETHVTALDVVNQAASSAYPEHISLNRGFSQPVKISYVFSCNRFYVQLKSKQDDLLRLMLDIQVLCRDAESIGRDLVKVGLPCYALFEADQQWYRSQVVEVLAGGKAKVHYVDYGNEEEVSVAILKPIEGKQLTVLRPQAIECCLNGYQNMEPDLERDNLLEELILEQEFTMKVVEMQGKKALIELIDAANYNVASLLLDKIAVTRSQVSPMLVQAGNKIEHRKSQQYPRDQPLRQEQRKPDRAQRQWNESSNDNSSWRQNNKGPRIRNSFETNEINENNSWKQNNKGFSKNYDRNRRDDLSDSNESDRQSNKGYNKNSDRNRNDLNSRNTDGGSWRQNNKGFNKNQDRFNRDNNRNTDWGTADDRKSFSPRNNDEWGGHRDGEKKNYNSRDHDNWGASKENDKRNFYSRDKDNWSGNVDNEKKTFNSREINEWGDAGGGRKEKDNWGGKDDRKGFGYKDNFRKNRDRSNDEKADWEVPSHKPGGFKKKPDFKRCERTQIIQFFEKFKQMMEDIQQAYKSRQASATVVGAPVIGLFPEDNVLYRAQVLETIGSQFKVYYVDFGNVSVVDKVWPIETRFMELPAQAICCRLDGIEAPSDAWPDASSYSQYFDKKQFLCRFISSESDRVSVRLEHADEDIASLLLRDGLAKSSTVVLPTVDVALLIGQQFRAMLLSVNSLADFVMSLQSGALLNCSVFNVGESAETWEDNLKKNLGRILIVYVDDLKEDILEVTLYDQNGAKIKLVDKDEGAFESVELLCPYLIVQPTLTGEVTHVEDKSIVIQPSECAETMEYLLNAMFERYDNSILENPIVPVEGYVYAVKGSDTNWYRGRVVSFDDSRAQVNYLDYGNSESVGFDALRELTIDFLDVQLMCVSVSVNMATENLLNQSVVVDLTFTEAGLEGTVRQEQILEVVAAEEVVPEVVECPVEVPESCGIEVVLSHADSPSDFYLQLAESIGAIEELQATLQEQVAEMADMENTVIGVLCAAPYSLDQQWYRALILDADSDITTVRFVDYGNTDVLDNQMTRVKTLPPHLLSLEVHATRCRLKIKPVDEDWGSAASERFEQLCSIEPLTAEFINQDEKTNYVELFSKGTNVREVLIEENLALPDEELPEAKSVGFVSHLNSPSEFWIQLENCIDELEWVAEQLSGAEGFAELEDLAPGTLCAALFPDDQMWYRARILSNTVAGIEVLFVDYGNSCTSCSLRELPEDLIMLAPLAQKCSLQKPETLTNWSPEMVKKFSEISADGQTTFNVKKLSTGETASVELLLDGVDVTTMLLPQTEDVRVKNFEGLELTLVKGDEELKTKFKLEALPDVVWNEESTKKFAEINNEGETVFQAEFVSEDTVRLYLGLNDIRFDLSGTKTATPSSSPLKARPEKANGGDDADEGITISNINEDIKTIVMNIVEASIGGETDKTLVKSLVAEIVEKSVDQIENSISANDNISKSVVESVVTNIIEQSLSQVKSSEPTSTEDSFNSMEEVNVEETSVAAETSSPKSVNVAPTTASPVKEDKTDEKQEKESCRNLLGIRETRLEPLGGPNPRPRSTASGSGFRSSSTDSTLEQWLLASSLWREISLGRNFRVLLSGDV